PPKRTRSKANGAALNGAGAEAETAAPKATPAKPPRKSSLEVLGDHLIASILKHDDDADVKDVRRAIEFAIEAHGGQKRASGEPYVPPPIASAQILADLGIDPVAVQAALLHDVPEDTEYSLSDIEERFG